MKKLFYALLAIWGLASCASNAPSSKTDKQHTESRVPVQRIITKSKFLDNGKNIRLYVNLNLDRTAQYAEVVRELVVNYTLYPDYTNRQIITSGAVAISTDNLVEHNGWFTFWFDIPKPKEMFTAIAMTEIRDVRTSNKVVNDCFIRFQSGKSSDYFAFFDKTGKVPVMQNYCNVQDSLVLKSLDNKAQSFRVFRYRYDFEPALSPMATSQRVPQKKLYVDSSFNITSNTPVYFNTEGLFYLTKDTTDSYGIGLVVADKRFPRMTRPEKLVRPLIYMSTTAETSDLWSSKEPKKAMDNYWLNITQGNQGNAKKTIKAFYQRVEQANRMFTSYKEGWKTDRGMVWIIMGEPTRINRTKDKEVWTYIRNGQYSEINFTFNKRTNQFVEDHYELQRYAEYQSIWFPTVEQWRTGEISYQMSK